jgi:prolipoprotein diacylglyceryl transferase
LAIWHGGLGIWGGVLAGAVVGIWVARRHGANAAVLADCAAPAIPLAQAIGRWGNWFNQELYGKPTRLPWALKIDHPALPFRAGQTFHPVFLYESIWDLCVVGIVLFVERHFRLRTGSLFAVYVASYTFGRFFTEYERIDTAHKIGPLRLNDWISIIVFVAALGVLIAMQRGRPAVAVEGVEATSSPPPGDAG